MIQVNSNESLICKINCIVFHTPLQEKPQLHGAETFLALCHWKLLIVLS